MPVLDKNNKEQVEKFEEFLNNSEYTRLTQTLQWGKVKSTWKQEVVYIEEDGKIVAAMTLLLEKVPKLKYHLMYCSRGPICDPNDVETVKKLVEEADVIAKKYNAFCLKLDPQVVYSEDLNNLYKKNGFKTSGKKIDHDKFIQPIYEAVLDIKDTNEDDLIKRFSEKTRYNIRLSKRKGVEVYHSHSKEDLKIFYELYKITCVRDKIGCRAYEYFEKMVDAFDEEHLRIYIAKHEQDNLSAAIAITYGTEMFYLYGASSNEKRNLMPNYAMQWEMIRWAIEKKCKTYNFGGILHLDKNNGLYKFKTGFCKEEGVLHYIGEIDKVYNKLIYFAYNTLLPILKKIKRKFRKIKQE